MHSGIHSFSVHGLNLDIAVPSTAALEAVENVLGPFAVSPETRGAFFCAIENGQVPQADPQGLRKFWSGRLYDGTQLVCWTGPARRCVDLPGLARLTIDFTSQRANVIVQPGQEWSLPAGCLVPLLCELLRQEGQHLLHAACVAVDGQDVDGKVGKGILIAGCSGRGKTTTSLAMAGAGQRLLTDDASFVSASTDGQMKAWGLPLRCKVHYNTMTMLPWLADLPARPSRKPEESSVQVCRRDAAVTVEPSLIILLDERNGREHILQPMSKIDALGVLTQENVRALDTGSGGPAGQAFKLFARMVQQASVYRLSAGPDIQALPEKILSLLR